MSNVVNIKDVRPMERPNMRMFWLLGKQTGCTSGCSMAVGYYGMDEFPPVGVHDDQEGFFVLEGSGYAQIGDDVIRLEPGVAFLVKPGEAHAIKRDASCEHIKALLFHAAP